MEIGRSRNVLNPGINKKRGNWIGIIFSGGSYQDVNDTISEYVSGVKIKTVLVKSNIFFEIFGLSARRLPPGDRHQNRKPLPNKGFKLFCRRFKGFFFF
jgi:hypothetical protein